MIKSSSNLEAIDDKLVAAIAAAVWSYLEEERPISLNSKKVTLRPWKLALRQQPQRLQFGGDHSWRGRD